MIVSPSILPLVLSVSLYTAESFSFNTVPRTRSLLESPRSLNSSRLNVATTNADKFTTRIPINEEYEGLKLIHSNPDIYTIENFLDEESCSDLIRRAKEKSMDQSPVAYAGWTKDVKDLLELAAKGPVAWVALTTAWLQVKDDSNVNQIDLFVHALQNYATAFIVAGAGILAYTKFRTDGLQSLRTSTSTTLDDLTLPRSSDSENHGVNGSSTFVTHAAKLFDSESPIDKEARLFEAPTVIRYEPGQVLAPHFDANRSAETEDANRGGQTLATLIVYLNDVKEGGLTRFGRLPARTVQHGDRGSNVENPEDERFLTVEPKLGDALLFFPSDQFGEFDERVEHEGCEAMDEKWIARIWRHIDRVPPPYGMSNNALSKL